MKQLSHYNQYDIFLFVFVISTIFGRYGILHPSTFLSVIFLPQLISKIRCLTTGGHKLIVVFLAFWLLYAFISLFWTPDLHDGFKDLALLFFHAAMFMEIIVLSMSANRPVQTMTNSWICAFLITSVIALWELNTGHHLMSAREEDIYYTNSAGDFYEKEYATVTFYNPNTYCYFICLLFPFLLYSLSQSKNRLFLFVNVVITILAIFIMSKNGSRGGLITMIIMISLFVYYKVKGSSVRKKILIFIALILIVSLLIVFADVLFGTLLFRLSQKDLLEDNARLYLWYSSWQLFINSFGLGIGVGGMVFALQHASSNLIGIYYSHNMILEILLEYGLLIALGFISFLFILFKYTKKVNNFYIKAVLMGSLLSFPFYSLINSENLRPTFIWVFFSTLYVFSLPNMNGIKR